MSDTLIRVPAAFYRDHDERECEPFCSPVKRTSRYVWLRPDDEGLDELLSDARHYADPQWTMESCYYGLKRSAVATVQAIEAARGCPQPAAAVKAIATIRVPDRFYIDHMERGLATPEDIGESLRYATIRVTDPAIRELLDDAEYYAGSGGPDLAPRGVTASARATVRAIRDAIGWEGAPSDILALRQ
jgi:hypothetical protein